MTPIMPPGENVLTGLVGIGFSADDIDVVVCSHLHPDHCGCNAFFKRASIIVHAKEIEAARKPNAVPMGYLASEWDFGTFDALSGERDVFGDGRIVLIAVAGPHAGQHRRAGAAREQRHVPARRRHRERCASALDTGVHPRNVQDHDALEKSFAEIRRIEAGGATILCGHDAAQWETLRKGADVL